MTKKPKCKMQVVERAVTTADILHFLDHRYRAKEFRSTEFVAFPELRLGPGFSAGCDQRIDYWVMHCYSGLQRTAYEIKVSRADFLKEMKQPIKRRQALLMSNEFWFIAPRGLIKIEEVPIECGLQEVWWTNNQNLIDHAKEKQAHWEVYKATGKHPTIPNVYGYHEREANEPQPEYYEYLTSEKTVPAPHRDTFPPSWRFVASLARRLKIEETNDDKSITTAQEKQDSEQDVH